MTTAALTKREMQKRLYAGFHPGLPAKSRYMPFGNDSRCMEATDLRPAELAIVVALLAGRVCGRPPATAEQILACTGTRAQRDMASLERRLWVTRVDKAPGSRNWRWWPTKRAFERLGFKDWEPELFSDAEIEHARSQALAGLEEAS